MSPRQMPDVLDRDEGAALLLAAGSPHRLWILFGLDAGLRVSEIVAVTPDNLQPGKPLLAVRGKGRVLRKVPLTARLLRSLAVEDMGRTALRIPPERPYVPVTTRTLQLRFKRLARAAGILLPGRTPHSLRHTYATRLVAAGVPLTSVQDVLGHRSLATTQVYLHCLPGWEADVSAALDMWLAATAPPELELASHFSGNATHLAGKLCALYALCGCRAAGSGLQLTARSGGGRLGFPPRTTSGARGRTWTTNRSSGWRRTRSC